MAVNIVEESHNEEFCARRGAALVTGWQKFIVITLALLSATNVYALKWLVYKAYQKEVVYF
jgi:hypothetical protein